MRSEEPKMIEPTILHHFFSQRMFHISYTQIEERKITLWHEHGLIGKPHQSLDKALFNFYEFIWIRMVTMMEEVGLTAAQIRNGREQISFVPDEEYFDPTSTMLERIMVLAKCREVEFFLYLTKNKEWLFSDNKKNIAKSAKVVLPIYDIMKNELCFPSLAQSLSEFLYLQRNILKAWFRKVPNEGFLNDQIERLQKRGKPTYMHLREIETFKDCNDGNSEQILHHISYISDVLYHFLKLRKKKGFLLKRWTI